MATSLSSRVLPALVSGAATAAYYATPDVIASRAARAWAKAGLLAVVAAASLPEYRAAVEEMRRARHDVVEATADSHPMPVRAKIGVLAVAAVAVVGGVAGVVAAERWIFRRGQSRAAAGASWSHTRTGLLMGAVATGLALVPMPDRAESSENQP